MDNQENYTRTITDLHISENGGQGMENDKIQLLKSWSFSQWIETEDSERKENAAGFLFSLSETKALKKAAECITKYGTPYADILKKNVSPDIFQNMVNDIFASFERSGLKLKKLRALSEKIKSGFYWSIKPEVIIRNDKDNKGATVESVILNYKVTISTQEEKIDSMTLDEHHPFLHAESMPERAKCLGLSEVYLYVTDFELNTLEVLKIFFSNYDANTATCETWSFDSKKLYSYVSTPLLNAPHNIGSNAKKPNVIKRRNEHGKQMSIAEYVTNTGDIFAIKDFDPHVSDGFITVGDPNTDKLLFQAQLKVAETGQSKITIPLSEYRKERGLSDAKYAVEQAKQACLTLLSCNFTYSVADDNANVTGGLNYVQECRVINKRGNSGSVIIIEFTDRVYRHILHYLQKGQNIEQIDTRIMRIPNKQNHSYNIARKLFHHVKFNAGKSNSHTISIKTLIDCCSGLPLYPETPEDAKKENYIRFPSEAPELIIKPFMKGLNFITEKYQENEEYQILKEYTIKKPKGGTLSKSELEKALKDYKIFRTLIIDFELSVEPDYTHLIEKRATHKTEQSNAANGAGESKPKKTKTKTKAKDQPKQDTPPKSYNSPFEGL